MIHDDNLKNKGRMVYGEDFRAGGRLFRLYSFLPVLHFTFVNTQRYYRNLSTGN